jgi:hypothetical protein
MTDIARFFANSCWEILLKVITQLLGAAGTIQESRWEMPESYWIAPRQFCECMGSSWEMLNNADTCWANVLFGLAISKNLAISIFFLSTGFQIAFIKSQMSSGKFFKSLSSSAPFTDLSDSVTLR